VLENIRLIRQFGLPKPANSRICCSNLFIELGTATGDAGQFLRIKRREKPSKVRISLPDIITFDGFFDSESHILKPRWLPTPMKPPKPDPQLYEARLKSYHDSMLSLGERSKRRRAQLDESSNPDFIDLVKGYCELRLALEHNYSVLEKFVRVHGTDDPLMIVAVAVWKKSRIVATLEFIATAMSGNRCGPDRHPLRTTHWPHGACIIIAGRSPAAGRPRAIRAGRLPGGAR